MNLNTVLQRMPLWYSAAINNPRAAKAIYLRSAPGRGKTTTICRAPQVIGEKLGMKLGLVVLNGGLLTPSDVIGFGLPKHYDTHSEMVWSDPFFFRTEDGKRLCDYDGGIILVDEADKMEVDCKKIIGEAALSGRLGPHRFAKNWVTWFTGNRAGDRSGSTKELDHMINRIRFIEITDDLQSLLDHMDEIGCLPLTQAFTQQNPQVPFMDAPEKQQPWCTPRSLVAADSYLQALTPEGETPPDDATTVEEVAGEIGGAAAAQYFAFVKLEREMPKYERIVAEPEKVKVPSKPDALMLVAYNLAHRVDEKDITPVIKYVERMPKEFAVPFLKTAVKRKSALVAVPAVQKWCLENSSLMAIIAK